MHVEFHRGETRQEFRLSLWIAESLGDFRYGQNWSPPQIPCLFELTAGHWQQERMIFQHGARACFAR